MSCTVPPYKGVGVSDTALAIRMAERTMEVKWDIYAERAPSFLFAPGGPTGRPGTLLSGPRARRRTMTSHLTGIPRGTTDGFRSAERSCAAGRVFSAARIPTPWELRACPASASGRRGRSASDGSRVAAAINRATRTPVVRPTGRGGSLTRFRGLDMTRASIEPTSRAVRSGGTARSAGNAPAPNVPQHRRVHVKRVTAIGWPCPVSNATDAPCAARRPLFVAEPSGLVDIDAVQRVAGRRHSTFRRCLSVGSESRAKLGIRPRQLWLNRTVVAHSWVALGLRRPAEPAHDGERSRCCCIIKAIPVPGFCVILSVIETAQRVWNETLTDLPCR